MSGQAKRARVRAAIRHRAQVARFIALSVSPSAYISAAFFGYGPPFRNAENAQQSPSQAYETAVSTMAEAVLDGAPFDVRAVRCAAEALVSQAEEHAQATAVYDEWRRWHGPNHVERMAGCPVPPKHHGMAGRIRIARRVLEALEGQASECTCLKRGSGVEEVGIRSARITLRQLDAEGRTDAPERVAVRVTPFVVCSENWTTALSTHVDARSEATFYVNTEHHRPRPQIRVQHTTADGLVEVAHIPVPDHAGGVQWRTLPGPGQLELQIASPRVCPSCNGTGHNLRGYLPQIDWPPAVRRRCLEHETHDLHTPVERQREGFSSWVLEMADRERVLNGPLEDMSLGSAWLRRWDAEAGENVYTPETRVGGRGEHLLPLFYSYGGPPLTLDRRISLRGWTTRGSPGSSYNARAPRWRIGELRHDKRQTVRNVYDVFMSIEALYDAPSLSSVAAALEACLRSGTRYTYTPEGVAQLEADAAARLGRDTLGASLRLDSGMVVIEGYDPASDQTLTGMVELGHDLP